MANRTIKIFGYNNASDTNITATWAGVEVHNGTLSASVVAFADQFGGDTTTPEELFEFTYNNADDTSESQHALRVTVNAGACSIGETYSNLDVDNTNYDTYPTDGKPPVTEIGGNYYWTPGLPSVFGANENVMSDRTNILINDATPLGDGSSPDGSVDNYLGWDFRLTNGDVLGCNVRVPAILVTNPNPGKRYGWSE